MLGMPVSLRHMLWKAQVRRTCRRLTAQHTWCGPPRKALGITWPYLPLHLTTSPPGTRGRSAPYQPLSPAL